MSTTCDSLSARPRRMFGLTAALALALCAAGAVPAHAASAPGSWQEVKTFASGQRHDIGVDAQGTLWLLSGNELDYWDGTRFRQAQSVAASGAGWASTGIVGGPDRGLFLAAGGKVYTLSDRQARYVVEYYTGPGAGPVYVAADGRLLQWGSAFLSPDLKKPDTRREAAFEQARPVVWDDGPSVHLLCNGRLYTAAPDGTITDVQCGLTPEQARNVVCVPWGPGRALVRTWAPPYLIGIDTATGKTFELPDLLDLVHGPHTAPQIAALPDGSALFLPYGPDKSIYQVSAGAPPRVLPGSAAIPREFAYQLARGEGWCLAHDGALWIGAPAVGLLEFRDGAIRTWGWRDGVRPGGFRSVVEDGAGTVFAIDKLGVYVFRPDGVPPPLPAGFELWTQVTPSAFVWPDLQGGVWALRPGRPETASHWDGAEWTDVQAPIHLLRVGGITDDRGHLLVCYDGPDDTARCSDVSPQGVQTYDSLEAALQAAVAGGARMFHSYSGTRTDAQGRIWFYTWPNSELHYFDGAEWHVSTAPDGTYVWPQGPKPVLLETVSGWSGRVLLGLNGLQDFDADLLKAHPGDYVPIERQGMDFTLLREAPKGDGTGFVRGDRVELGYGECPLPAPDGGIWIRQMSEGASCRIFDGRLIRPDLSRTPLRGTEPPGTIFQDRGHNVWVFSSGGTFMERLAGFRVRLGPVPDTIKRVLTVDVGLELPGLAPGQGHLFYRVDAGGWEGGGPPGRVRIPFSAAGPHRVEFLGMDALCGSAPETPTLSVQVTMSPPGTRMTGPGPFNLTDVLWRPPVESVPSGPDEHPVVLCRIDGGEWRPLEDGALLLAHVAPGAHLAEFEAEEEGKYRDSIPVRAEFTYAPDYDRIVERRMDALLGRDAQGRAAALRELKAAGPGVVEVLRGRLAKVHRDAAAAERLEALRVGLERPLRPAPRGAARP